MLHESRPIVLQKIMRAEPIWDVTYWLQVQLIKLDCVVRIILECRANWQRYKCCSLSADMHAIATRQLPVPLKFLMIL